MIAQENIANPIAGILKSKVNIPIRPGRIDHVPDHWNIEKFFPYRTSDVTIMACQCFAGGLRSKKVLDNQIFVGKMVQKLLQAKQLCLLPCNSSNHSINEFLPTASLKYIQCGRQ